MVLVTPVFAPSVGGIELHHQIVAREVARSSRMVVLTADLNLRLSHGSTNAWASDGDVEVRYLPSRQFLGERLIHPGALFRALRSVGPTVVWTNQPSLAGDLAGLYARLARVPWVATYFGDPMLTRVYGAAYRAFEHRWIRGAAAVMPQGPLYATWLQRHGVLAGRIFPVRPGPGIGQGRPPAIPDVDPPAAPGPLHPLLFVGGLDRAREYKRPDALIRAVAALRRRGIPVALWMVGDGDRRAELEALARQLGVPEAVEFLGRVGDQELAGIYARAWALVLPSTPSEAFGLVTLEALAYGCPSILPDELESAATLAPVGAALSYPANDPQGLEQAIQQVWTSAEIRPRLARRCRELSASYGWEGAAPTIARIILGPGATDRALGIAT